MGYKSVKGYGGWAQLGFLFAFVGFAFVITAIVQLVFVMKMMPANAALTDADALLKAMAAPQNIGLARVSQVIGTLLLLFMPAVLWSFVANGKKLFWLGFNKFLSIPQILVGALIILAASVVAGPLADLSKEITVHFPSLHSMAKNMESTYNAQVLALSNLTSLSEYILALVIMAFLPAMFEEVFFRGCLQNFFTRWWKSPAAAILFSALIFSLIHMSIWLFLSRLLLGVALGVMFYQTKNIWVNIFAHFLNNAFAVTQMYQMSGKATKVDLEKLDPHMPAVIVIAAAAALAGLVMLLKKISRKKVEHIDRVEQLSAAKSDPFHAYAQNINPQSGA